MNRHALSMLVVLAAAGSYGCVQRAILLPILKPTLEAWAEKATRSVAPSAIVNDPAPDSAEGTASAVGRRFAIRAADSKLEVGGGDLFTGMHVMRFRRWRGALVTDAGSPVDRPSGHLSLEIDLTTLETDPVVDDSLRNHLLEVDRHPRCRIAGTLRPRADQGSEYVVQGRILVHGVERAIRFYAELRRSGDEYHLDSVFDMSRKEFDMHRNDAIEYTIYNDFRVTLGLIAHPESVSAEVLPSR